MFEVENSENSLRVACKVPVRKRAKDPFIKVNTDEVVDFLLKSGYDLESYTLREVGTCNNVNGELHLRGVWVWEKNQPPVIEEKKEVKNEPIKKPVARKRRQPAAKKDKLLGTKDME